MNLCQTAVKIYLKKISYMMSGFPNLLTFPNHKNFSKYGMKSFLNTESHRKCILEVKSCSRVIEIVDIIFQSLILQFHPIEMLISNHL